MITCLKVNKVRLYQPNRKLALDNNTNSHSSTALAHLHYKKCIKDKKDKHSIALFLPGFD